VFSTWNAADLLARLSEAGIPAGKVCGIDEVYAWDQTRSQGLLIDVDHDALGRITLPGPPLRFFSTSGTERTRSTHRPPPHLDQHGHAVRSWIGTEPGQWCVVRV
jgi:crotonobetainyl-CoA:carnitine CoA-transferase CaiB-like acyl-CoA transferase